jgi:hypothetical protein
MARWLIVLAILPLLAAAGAVHAAPAVQLNLDTSEAEQALGILDREAAGQAVATADWDRLFATAPYRLLKAREGSMGRRLSDDAFRTFLQDPKTIARRGEWRATLDEVRRADIKAIGAGVLAWLPPGATITARVFPEIKPAANSFVWTATGDTPGIFLYLKRQTRDQFENTVVHECHHIGLNSLEGQTKALTAGLPENVRRTINWLGGFGEGEAMLAAAGAERHPHWMDDADTRARWDGDMMNFNADLPAVQQAMEEILDGKLKTPAEIQARAAPFWGDAQGAWYTVGYEMAVLVERRFGRKAFNDCLLDPRKLLALYNQVAAEANAKGAKLALWSPAFLARLEAAS